MRPEPIEEWYDNIVALIGVPSTPRLEAIEGMRSLYDKGYHPGLIATVFKEIHMVKE